MSNNTKASKPPALGQSAPQTSGYSEAAGSHSRRAFKGFNPNSTSPNEDINWNNFTMRQRARMLYMGAPIATSAINTNRTKVVGAGLVAKPTINHKRLGMTPEAAKLWAQHTEEEFSLWASKKQNCDSIAMNNFAGLQQIAVVSWLTSGDVFALVQREDPTRLNPYSLRMHLVEADRISTPSSTGIMLSGVTDGMNEQNKNDIFDGVEVDSKGKVVAYHVCNSYPIQQSYKRKPLEWTRVLAYGKETGLPNILHVMSAERPEQYRGVSYLAQAMEPILQMRRFTESTLMAALVQTYFTAWVTTDTDQSEIPFNEVGSDVVGKDGGPKREMDANENEYDMGPGTINHMADGEKITFGNPNIPTATFDEFCKSIAKLCGAALEIPQEILLKEFNSSYSAARAALLEAWEAFKVRRRWLVDDFCQPVYELWLSEAVARGRISAPGFFDDPAIREAWCKVRWMGPVQGQLDPLKEVNAAEKQVNNAFKTRSSVTLEMGGGDWHENVSEMAIENQMLADAQVETKEGGSTQ
ncbi:phage portal protein [Bengtsoniella intestinalis]|uniref:phage portal protein n=1 Tax=Bengtsoniella intestinalis TaxID=3073143 RepID=UPI00391F3ED2